MTNGAEHCSGVQSTSRFGGSRTKKGGGEGKGEEETRSGKIRIETGADWLIHNALESSRRVFTLYNL